MLQTFSVTLTQMLKLFFFILIGFCLRRWKKGADVLSSALSQLEVMVCLPALCFSTFSARFTAASLSTERWVLLAGVTVLAAGFAAAWPLSRWFGRSVLERDVYLYSFTVPNLAYLGYPIVEAVWGPEMLYHFMMFTMPFNVFIYTVGINLLNPRRTWTLKGLLNPTMLALVAGMAVGLTGLRLPAFLSESADMAGACLAPLAMILTGCVLGALPLDRSFIGGRTLLASLLRLLLLPLIALLIFRLTGASSVVAWVSVALLAMPFGLNSVIFPEAFGGDSATGARLCFLSHLLSVITIPLVLGLTSLLIPA